MSASREDIRLPSGGETIAGWLYRPAEAAGEAPCVVLAHGFGALKEARLDAYAERFAGAGMAALVFDYRHFGASGGEPRTLIDVGRQHADYRAAIAHARTLDGIDPDLGHFDVYVGEAFERSVADQLDFLERHVA